MHSSVPILLVCAIALISPSTAQVTVHHTTTKTVFGHACPNTTLHTSGYPSASTNMPTTTLFNSTTRDLCPLTRSTNWFMNETMPSPTGTAACTLPSGLGASCMEDLECCWPLWCDVGLGVCGCPGEGSAIPPAFITTSITSISSKAPPSPIGKCTLPSTVGADCGHTGQCCSPLWCDKSTYLCASPGWGSGLLPPPGASSISTFSTALSARSGGCISPSTVGADCSDTLACCSPLECDLTTKICVPSPIASPVSSSSSSPPSPTACSYPNTVGADCASTQRCCSPLVCDGRTNTCKDPNVCTDPNTVGADCSRSGHCCPPLECAGPETGCIDPSCTDPRTLGASCEATGRCCPPYVCGVGQTCISA